MGVFGALNAAVSGIAAQSYALENISGNIANASTTGYKRLDTSFSDLVGGGIGAQTGQLAGTVNARSRATNGIQGDLQQTQVNTYMAINGSGYFVVQSKIGEVDGNSIFSGQDLYTRRGDFELDKEGRLVNGAGYYLMGQPIDRVTNNVTGSVPELIRIDNSVIPAVVTDRIRYEGNLPTVPQTKDYLDGGSDTLAYSLSGSAPYGVITGSLDLSAGLDVSLGDESFNIAVDGDTPVQVDLTQADSGGDNIYTADEIEARINAALAAAGQTATVSVTLDVNNNLQITSNHNGDGSSVTIADPTSGTSAVANLGFTSGDSDTTTVASPATISAAQEVSFLNSSIAGGAITVYNDSGTPVNVQMRWAKIEDAATSGSGNDEWALYYLSDSTATGGGTKWTKIEDAQFGSDGQLVVPVSNTMTITGLSVDGASVGDVTLDFGANALTQFADSNGAFKTSKLTQNGYPSGDMTGITISEAGRIVASYSNGRTRELYEISLVSFSGEAWLERKDGGTFGITPESGQPIAGATGSIVGQRLEASNTDIADEFSKLIITQQAYSANARIVSSSDELLQEAVNMVR